MVSHAKKHSVQAVNTSEAFELEKDATSSAVGNIPIGNLGSPEKSRQGKGLHTHTNLGFSAEDALREKADDAASIDASAAGNRLAPGFNQNA